MFLVLSTALYSDILKEESHLTSSENEKNTHEVRAYVCFRCVRVLLSKLCSYFSSFALIEIKGLYIVRFLGQ